MAQDRLATDERRSRGVPNNLPAELTSFVGRSEELSRVRKLLGQVRLLTLLGSGGCGKTRLALQSATHGIDSFPGGTWWVELAALDDRERLAVTVAMALGVRERPGRASLDVVAEHIGDRRTLLVLDNCEHLLAPCATLVDTLLRSCRDLVVLTTSREALRVPGEMTYRVPSLDLPPESGTPFEVAMSDAAHLFIDRANHVCPGFALTEGNAASVGVICRALDGIPLAIELAAARVRMLSPDQIAEALDDRLRLLTGGARTVALRHQTLRASIDWSHDLCSEQERVLLRRLSVCAGGWTLEGAEAVTADGAVERRAVLDLLSGLVDRSLVESEERSGVVRYRMLESIRQYAAEHLVAAGELDSARARHLAWCLELAERAEPELLRHDAGVWLARLDHEVANLHAALDWAAVADSEGALRLAAALTFFWLLRGRLEEGAAAFAGVLEVAPEPSAVRGKALWGLAYLNIYRGRLEACSEYAERALADGEAAGDRSVMARALVAKGFVLSLTDHVRGRPPLERSLALAREAKDDWCTADATRMLAGCYMRQSEHDLGRPIQEESYALARARGYKFHQAWYFDVRAMGELEHGRLQAARELAEQARAVANETGEPVTLGFATAVLMECDVLQGPPGQARARAEPYIRFMRGTGARSAEGWIQGTLAMADVAEGDADAARKRIDAVLPAIEAAAAYDQVARAHRLLAVALLLLGDLDGAGEEAERLLRHAQMGLNEHVEVIARDLQGRVALARGAVVEAEGHLHEALAIAARRDFRLQTLNVLESLARVALLTDSPKEAVRLLAAVRAGREQLGVVRWPSEPDTWAKVEEHARTELGDEVFSAVWSEGLDLSISAAVGYASRARGKRRRPSLGWESLTPTELEVVRQAASGLSNPQIAERMFVSRATVKAHLSHIFDKLGLSSRSQLAAEATRRNLDGPAVPETETYVPLASTHLRADGDVTHHPRERPPEQGR